MVVGLWLTLHPTPFALDATLRTYTHHPTPYTLHPTLHTMRPAPCTLHVGSCSQTSRSVQWMYVSRKKETARVCVCARERERECERETARVCERESERERSRSVQMIHCIVHQTADDEAPRSTEGPSWGYPSLALPRSWSHFVGNCCQKLTNLIEINFF